MRELLQSDHLENVSMRPDAGPCLPDPEVEVPVVITIELLHAAGSQPVQPCQQLLCLGLVISFCVDMNNIYYFSNNLIKTRFDYLSWFENTFRHFCGECSLFSEQLVSCSQSSCTFKTDTLNFNV